MIYEDENLKYLSDKRFARWEEIKLQVAEFHKSESDKRFARWEEIKRLEAIQQANIKRESDKRLIRFEEIKRQAARMAARQTTVKADKPATPQGNTAQLEKKAVAHKGRQELRWEQRG